MPRHARQDGLANCVTGLGDPDLDTRVNTFRTYERPRTVYELEREFLQNWMAAVEVETIPDAVFSRGVDVVNIMPEEVDWDLDAIQAAVDGGVMDAGDGTINRDPGLVWHAWHTLKTGDKLAGAALYAIVDDGLDPREPLDVRRINKVVAWEVLDRSEITPYMAAGASEPEWWYLTYLISIPSNEQPLRPGDLIHTSRLFFAKGVQLSRRESQYRQWWGGSVLDRNRAQRLGVEEGWDYLRTYMDRASWIHISFADLDGMLRTKDEAGNEIGMELLQGRMREARKIMRTLGIFVSDGGTNGYKDSSTGQEIGGRPADQVESIQESSGGLADMVEADTIQWARGTGRPRTLALGDPGPAFSSGSNTGDLQKFMGDVQSVRRWWGTPAMMWMLLITFAAKSGPTKGVIPESWGLDWRPLHMPTPLEKAQLATEQANADRVRIESEVVKAKEVRKQRVIDGDVTGDLRVDPTDDEDDAGLGSALVGIARAAVDGAIAVGRNELSPEAYASLLTSIESARWPPDVARKIAEDAKSGLGPVMGGDGQPVAAGPGLPTEDAAPEADVVAPFSDDPRPTDLVDNKAIAALINERFGEGNITSQRVASLGNRGEIRKWGVGGKSRYSKAEAVAFFERDNADPDDAAPDAPATDEPPAV